jgi:kinesin family protein 6/9
VFLEEAFADGKDLDELTYLTFGPRSGGKTFFTTGGTKSFNDRGLIPRALSHFLEGDHGCHGENGLSHVDISFFEIYKGNMYDLLKTRDGDKRKLRKIGMVTGAEEQNTSVSVNNTSTSSTASSS